MKRAPLPVYFLWILIFFLSIGAWYGGLSLITDPSGSLLQITTSYLDNSPFNDFLIPGLILLIFLGIFPLFLLFGFIKKDKIKWAGILNIYLDQHWAWTYSLYLSIMLIIWINIQIIMVGYDILQSVYSLYGVVILILTLLPGVKAYFSLDRNG